MTFKRLLGIAVAVCAFAALVGSVGAAASAPARRATDLSTNAGVKAYLHSHGISLRGVVIQRGARNYAGPRCPGKGWTCTASHRVVQIATGRGTNMFRCALARCVVVQSTKSLLAINSAKCIKTSGITQSCSITQSSTSSDNQAVVVETASKQSGLTQNVSQTAQITQTSNTGQNKACVLQTASVDTSTVSKTGTPVTITLDAHQSIAVTQNSHSGGNVAENASASGSCLDGQRLTQTQTLTSTATSPRSITQNENAANAGPNTLLNIQQNQGNNFFGTATGQNTAAFNQKNTLSAVANSSAGPVNQTQSSVNGGILAQVNQDSRDVSTADAMQTETQCEDAHTGNGSATCDTNAHPPGYSLTQTQFGPVKKGGGDSVQSGNAGDTFTITQGSKQDNDTGNGQTNVVQGDCHTAGNCAVVQTTAVQGQTTTNAQSGQDLDTTTNCTGADCNTTCTGSSCTTFTENGNQFAATNVDVGEFGAGGMRGGDGTGSIDVSGVDGPVAKALLYWNGPTNSDDPNVNAQVSFAGTTVTGTNIGVAGDNNWGFLNSQSYRADVTGLVSGNGTYALANFTKELADINGVALVVFYVNGSGADNRNVVLWNGNDSNCGPGGSPETWDETITGVPYVGGSASLDFVVGDGQTFADDALVVNGTTIVPAGSIFDGNTGPNVVGNGSLWDVKSFDITSVLTAGSNDLHLTTGTLEDCLSLVVAAANVPASAPVITAPAAAPMHMPVTEQARIAPTRPAAPAGGRGAVG